MYVEKNKTEKAKVNGFKKYIETWSPIRKQQMFTFLLSLNLPKDVASLVQ